MTRTIEITVSPKGETTVQTKGFACREASKFVEDALGQRTGETLTSEFYQKTEQQLSNQQRT